jgi:hypothetical protein
VLAALALLCSPVRAEVVARVNGAPITEDSVNAVVKSLIVERGGAPSSEEIAQLNDTALDSLIDLELLYQAAVKRDVRVSDQDVQGEIARSKARLGGDKAFTAALQRSGMTEGQLAAETRKTMMVERLVDQLTADIQLSPEQVRRFYDDHRDEFRPGESFDQARPAVERALRESLRRQRQAAYLADLRRTATIERPTPVAHAPNGT